MNKNKKKKQISKLTNTVFCIKIFILKNYAIKFSNKKTLCKKKKITNIPTT